MGWRKACLFFRNEDLSPDFTTKLLSVKPKCFFEKICKVIEAHANQASMRQAVRRYANVKSVHSEYLGAQDL